VTSTGDSEKQGWKNSNFRGRAKQLRPAILEGGDKQYDK
jgi:hypothetical protein